MDRRQMDPQYLWPLAGVALGWLLTSISSGWKARLERRKLLGKLLVRLLRVRADVTTAITASEHAKDFLTDWESFERIRQRMFDRHFLEPEQQIEEIRGLLSELAGYSPMLAMRLEKLLQLLLEHKTAKMPATAKIPDAYVRIISLHETGLEFVNRALANTIYRLAWSLGIKTGIQVWWYESQRANSFNKNKEFASSFVRELFELMEKRSRGIDGTSGESVPSDRSAQPGDQE